MSHALEKGRRQRSGTGPGQSVVVGVVGDGRLVVARGIAVAARVLKGGQEEGRGAVPKGREASERGKRRHGGWGLEQAEDGTPRGQLCGEVGGAAGQLGRAGLDELAFGEARFGRRQKPQQPRVQVPVCALYSKAKEASSCPA